ncbi:MAG: cyclic-di-AMP receptor [Dehalococcoidia bacterium]|nr:cyclic-di-AMP receptor [Dehalococcoidia bacterium]
MTQEASTEMKFCIVIVPSGDGERLLNRMAEQGFPATRIGSTGGFLKRGSATVFSALAAERIPELVALLHQEFPEVTERMPAASLPFMDEIDIPSAAMIDVRVGGAVLFVLPLDRMVRV